MRKLASIQTIKSLDSIPGADFIERATVLGWHLVVKKGEFNVGDRVVYIEVDSLLPEREEFEFLRAGSYQKPLIEGGNIIQRAGFRIRTVRLRKQVSQGLCVPTSVLPAGVYELDEDVTERLDIIKHEPLVPACLRGEIRRPFPSFIPKTDETRVQVLEETLEEYRGYEFYVTEKVDGTSCTIYSVPDDRGVCGRNYEHKESSSSTYCEIVRRLSLLDKLDELRQELGHGVALQAELLGPGIQKNKYGLREHKLFVFNVLSVHPERNPLQLPNELATNIVKRLGLQSVPQLGKITLQHSVDELVEFSVGKSTLNPKIEREGLVIREATSSWIDCLQERVSFKVINPKFLLKHSDD